jgi:hypothetical protein
MKKFRILFTIALLALLGLVTPTRAQSFVHPGLLHSREDLERMKEAVARKQEPIFSGFELFRQNPVSQHTYKMQGPMEMVGRNPTVGQGTYDTDANAAHQNAIMWAITGEKAYAEKAKEIINAWSATLKSITGRDAVLMAGLGPFKMVNAAEILRYTHAGWSEADIKKTEQQFKEVIYPVLKDFAPFANGNWDAAAVKTVMAIGVFCNDRPMFERALRYYVNGHGDGTIWHYIINEDGQIQESGRDQAHTQLGVAMMGECSEIAWHQGLDLYGYADNRLLKGFEYVAKFNLGQEVPFVTTLDRTGKYFHKTIARHDRGPLRAVYEQIYHHYVNRMGLAAPYTQQAAEKIRPEGPGRPSADHPGYGTLFYTKPKTDALKMALAVIPAAPGAIIAMGTTKEIKLTWVAPVGATTYTVKRATKSGGPYSVVAKNLRQPTYADKQVKPGTVYYYTVAAANAKGTSKDAYETGISAGLPGTWKQQDIGADIQVGSTSFDGRQFKLEGGGMGLDSISDRFHFAYLPLNGDGEIVARFVPQPSSQFSRMGLMMRETLTADAAHVSLLIYPGKTAQIEAPSCHLRLLTRTAAGQATSLAKLGPPLPDPVVTHGRLTGPYWLKLSRKGNTFTGYSSADGQTWMPLGSTEMPLKKNLYVGLPVASGLKTVTTTIMFDQVKAPGWK